MFGRYDTYPCFCWHAVVHCLLAVKHKLRIQSMTKCTYPDKAMAALAPND